MKRLTLVLCSAFLLVAPLGAQITFGGLDLNQADELLFEARAEVPTFGRYQTLFQASIPSASMRQLTFFPERFMRVGSGSTVQIQNRFGVFRSTDAGVGFEPVARFPAFVQGREVQMGKTMAIGASPDGRFLSYMVATSPAYGEIRLYDAAKDTETVVARRVELALDSAPVAWSPRGDFLVYAKGGALFYYSIEHLDSDRVLSESMRRIGNGRLSSVRWGVDNALYYVTGSQVFRILGVEFFTRSLYQDLLKIGTLVGKLPWVFDPNFDQFWISPDGQKVLLSKDGRNITVFFLRTDDFLNTGETISLPYLYLPRNTRVSQVLWSTTDVVTIMAGSIRAGESSNTLYRLNLADTRTRSAFTRVDESGVTSVSLSPNGERVLAVQGDRVTVRRYNDWALQHTIEHPQALHAVWMSDNEITVAGRQTIERVNIAGLRPQARLLALSQVDQYGYDAANGSLRVAVGNRRFQLADSGWAVSAVDLNLAPRTVASRNNRVYLAEQASGRYANAVMVRRVEGVGTVPLFPRPQTQYEAFPTQDQPVDLTNFSHGSRIRRREVSLVFNAIDSVDGLTEVLNTLQVYNVRATFFLNGDFIRRHPGAVREIAESGHEVGSLFFTHFDMSSSRFQITRDFIKQGLARNEDEFFETTGRELSLLWHAPFYFVNPEIIAASREMNYAYVGRDVDALDWVPKRDEQGISRLYMSSSDLVERILQLKQPGSIIAMTIGRPGDDRVDGGRDDYLFQQLDVVLNSLIERGYSVVPVSTLMDNAR